MVVFLVGGVGFLIGAIGPSPYEKHPHYVWGVNPSFFTTHYYHDDEEVIENVIRLMWAIGDYCWHEGFHFQLVRIAKACLELDPSFGEAYESAAWILVSYTWKREALKLLKRYLATNPGHYEPYFELGWFYYHWLKDPKAAIPWFEKAVKLPHPPIIEHTLAHAYEKAGRLQDALRVWANKLKRFPGDPIAKRHYERLKSLLRGKEGRKE